MRAEANELRPRGRRIFYHLPGLFEFYELYSRFLPLYESHPEYFYDWCAIGSIYGAPADCLWGGGRVGYGDDDAAQVLALLKRQSISARLTFSNSLLRPEHLADKKCNALCKSLAEAGSGVNGVILHSDLLAEYLREVYPALYLVSSTTKVLTRFDELRRELEREAFSFVVPDFRLNKRFDELASLPQEYKDKVELLCNECCPVSCAERRACYENVSRKSLGEDCADHICPSAGRGGYRFSEAMRSPAFISVGDVRDVYAPMGFSHFKLEGRSLGSAVVLEMLLYYMVRPEHQLSVREEIYLDGMLDLF